MRELGGLPLMRTFRYPKRRPTHPGQVLREDVPPALRMTQGELGRRLGVLRLSESGLLLEKRSMTPDMPLCLARLMGTAAESRLGMREALSLW